MLFAYITGLRGSAFYARGLWDRLNGGGRRPKRSGIPFGLPAPRAQREPRVAAIARLLREINMQRHGQQAWQAAILWGCAGAAEAWWVGHSEF